MRTKSALLLIGAVGLGMILGGLLTGAMVNRRMHRIAELRTTRGMAFRIEEIVQPDSPEQREAIREVLDQAAPRFGEIFEQSRAEVHSVFDSVLAELEGVLTEEQQQRLERHMKQRGRRPPFGPPPDRRRPPPYGPDDERQPRQPLP